MKRNFIHYPECRGIFNGKAEEDGIMMRSEGTVNKKKRVVQGRWRDGGIEREREKESRGIFETIYTCLCWRGGVSSF